MTKDIKAIQKLNDKQLFLCFAVMVSLAVNWFFGIILSITGLSFWIIFVAQTIISLFALLLIRKIKD